MKNNEQWSSKIGFILAAAGSAIGLGAIWKFPYMAGTNGGSVFFILFILFTALIGTPILLAEFAIGRKSQTDAITAYKRLAPGTKWHWVGYIGVSVSFIILSFYSVVGGWILSYLARSLTGSLSGLSKDGYEELFQSVISNPWEVLTAQLLFIALTASVVQGGIQKGIERASRYMMPALFILFLVLAVRSLTLDGAMKGVQFLLNPDFSKMNSQTVLLALGQSFFALTVGISIMVTYSSYLPKSEDLLKSASSVAFLNILISFLAGIVIFPAVFALGFEPSAGPGLIFVVLPAVFDKMAFGGLFLTVFLVLLLFATLTSAFSLLEIMVSSMTRGKERKRKKYTALIGAAAFIFGIPSALSFGVLDSVRIFERTFFDFADFLTTNIGLPLGGLLISVFAGYYMKRNTVMEELLSGGRVPSSLLSLWFVIIRFIVPVAILAIFLSSFKIIS